MGPPFSDSVSYSLLVRRGPVWEPTVKEVTSYQMSSKKATKIMSRQLELFRCTLSGSIQWKHVWVFFWSWELGGSSPHFSGTLVSLFSENHIQPSKMPSSLCPSSCNHPSSVSPTLISHLVLLSQDQGLCLTLQTLCPCLVH